MRVPLLIIGLAFLFSPVHPSSGGHDVHVQEIPPNPDYDLFLQEPSVSHSDPKFFELIKQKKRYACNPLVKKIFGISGPTSSFDYIYAGTEERKICPRLMKTCCNAEEMNMYAEAYHKGIKRFKNAVELVRETLYMFRGAHFQEFLAANTIPLKAKCSDIFNGYRGKYSDQVDFFSPRIMQENLLTLFSISNEMDSYIKSVDKIYGGMLCTACAARTHQLFLFNKNHPVIKVSLSMCARIIEMRDYEYRLSRIYRDFLYPLAKSIICLKDFDSEEGYDVNGLEDEYYIAMKKKLTSCKQQFDESNANCQEVCRLSFFKFKFPKGLIQAYTETLKVLYLALAERKIEKYYKKYKKCLIETVDQDEIDFVKLEGREDIAYLKMEQVEHVVSHNGLNVFLYPYHAGSASIWGMGVRAVLAGLILAYK